MDPSVDNGVQQVSFVNLLEGADTTPDTMGGSNYEDMYQGSDGELRLALRVLGGYVHDKYQTAKTGRNIQERIWRTAWNNYRGEFSPEELVAIAEKRARNPQSSSVFLKITKTKVLAATGQILDVLEAEKRFPILIEPTPVPDGLPEYVYLESEQNSQKAAQAPDMGVGYNGDGQDIPKGATQNSLLGGIADRFKNFLGNKQLVAGPAPDKNQLMQFNPAELCAEQMDKLTQDQLVETDARGVLRRAVFECALLGTGIIKGPFSFDLTVPSWNRDDPSNVLYEPRYKKIPKISHTSCWNFFPDPMAVTMEDAEFVVERHLMSPQQVRALRSQPFFDSKAIDEVLTMTPNADDNNWEEILKDNGQTTAPNRYEVLEYWGVLDRKMAEDIQMALPDGLLDTLQVNIWVCHNQVLRAVINPFAPSKIPYQVIPYETHGYQLWGIGISENMSDDQLIMNGHYNMALDNLKLAGQCVFEINEELLAPGQDMRIYPGRVFRTLGQQPGQSIYSIKFDNTAPAHFDLLKLAHQYADEKTGIQSVSYGQTGVSPTSRTAAGMSMLLGASSGNIKMVIKNIDNYGLKPLGDKYFAWNMQFNTDLPEIHGDLEVKAGGTQAMMQREVMTQRLTSLIQVGANPSLAPFINFQNILRALAKNMDLDPDEFVNDPKMAALYAQTIMGPANASQAPNPNGQPGTSPQAGAPSGPQSGNGAQPPTGGVDPSDPTGSGGGNIGIGTAPKPGESAFSSNAH